MKDYLRVGDERVFHIINRLHNDGFCVLLYVHIGILFCRYPNPISYNYPHECIDKGGDIVDTAHSHSLGCMEKYKGKPIFHSLGDFVMDGNSYRRRRSAILTLIINEHKIENWNLILAEINFDYETIVPSEKIKQQMMKSFIDVSNKLSKHSSDYESFFKIQYKKELAIHIGSTLKFLWKQRGVTSMLKMVWQRMENVKMIELSSRIKI